MVRKVTEISLPWQLQTVKTMARPCSAEQGVEDVLKQGVGMWSSVLGSPHGRRQEHLGGQCGLPTLCCPRCLFPVSHSDAVADAMLLLIPVRVLCYRQIEAVII